jgi:hypothetical protein
MLARRLFVAVICAVVSSGAMMRFAPACDRAARAGAPACCRNEATCPMHQKHSGGTAGLMPCHGDGSDQLTIVIAQRAVLTSSAASLFLPERARTFVTPALRIRSLARAPLTPPPRIG